MAPAGWRRHALFVHLPCLNMEKVEVCYNAGAQFIEPPEGRSREAYSPCG